MILEKLKRIYKVPLRALVVKPGVKLPEMEEKNQKSQSILEALKAHHKVKILNSEAVEKKLSSLIEGGTNMLQVFSDFDFTISRLWLDDGAKGPSSHGVIEAALPGQFNVVAKQIFDTYYPIEIDPTLTIEEKIPSMIEWWNSTHANMIASGLTKAKLTATCQKSGIVVRHGFSALAQSLLDDKIPLLIFSAGIADVLEGVIRALDLSHPNQTIIGNRMIFNEDPNSDGKLIGFRDPLIHVFNKNEALKMHLDYFEAQKSRKNSILMGDSLGDLKMVEGVKSVANCLTIGFLNTKVDEMLGKYMENFDIVLVDDNSMDVPNHILDCVRGG